MSAAIYYPGSGGSFTAANQSEMEAASSTTVAATPGVIKHNPGEAKAWISFNGSGTPAILDSHNVSSITDNGAGDWTINFTTAFSSADFAGAGLTKPSLTDVVRSSQVCFPVNATTVKTTTSCRLRGLTSNSFADNLNVDFVWFGDQ